MTKSAAHISLCDFINRAAANTNCLDADDRARYNRTISQKAAVMIVSRQMTFEQVREIILTNFGVGRHDVIKNIQTIIAE